MKKFLLLIFCGLPFSCFAQSDLIGTWKFTEYIYQGHTLPEPNPNLDLRFTFYSNGYSILKWLRTDETGFCERLASYSIEDNQWLLQKTIWLNPDNDISCSTDAEMHLGYETKTHFRIESNRFFLHLALDGEPFIYIFDSVSTKNFKKLLNKEPL